jgi:hypothetical protein
MANYQIVAWSSEGTLIFCLGIAVSFSSESLVGCQQYILCVRHIEENLLIQFEVSNPSSDV